MLLLGLVNLVATDVRVDAVWIVENLRLIRLRLRSSRGCRPSVSRRGLDSSFNLLLLRLGKEERDKNLGTISKELHHRRPRYLGHEIHCMREAAKTAVHSTEVWDMGH